MELFVQEKLSLTGKVEIKDANDVVVFKGRNGTFFNKKKTYLYDANGKNVVTIVDGGFFTRSFKIKKGKKTVAVMKQKLSLIKQNFKVSKLGWDVKGNLTFTEYHITNNGEKVADVTKKKLVSLLEAYSVDIAKEEDAAVAIAVVMIINKILGEKKGNLVKSVTKR